MLKSTVKPILFVLGWISFALGFVGAFLPVLPTTPFLILSAYLFSKSSKRFHLWLLNLPTFGPMIKEWEDKKVIRPKVKVYAISVLSLFMSISIFFFNLPNALIIMLVVIWLSVMSFIATRKSQ